ncbi:MAG: homoserine kinase [Gemmatimonadetes bacterium]|nr:homoserine kinase [Gemmatimonadota bacterium]
MSSVRVRVPATTGNLGSGYDCAGMALGLYNTIEFTETESGLDVVVEGEGADAVPLDESNLCIVSARAVFNAADWHPAGLKARMRHAIPVSRGLGSSGVAIVAGAVAANALAANALAGRPLDTPELLRICSDLEGHPDNVVPSLLGGLSVSGERAGTIVYQTFSVPSDLKAVVAIPEFTLDTKVARGVLPESVSMEDAVYNLCSVGLLVGGMASGNYALLREGMADRLHQPYRQHLVPGLAEVTRDALDAGAHGAALSGAGPTAIALASENHEGIGDAMVDAFARHGVTGQYRILPIDNEGCQVLPD